MLLILFCSAEKGRLRSFSHIALSTLSGGQSTAGAARSTLCHEVRVVLFTLLVAVVALVHGDGNTQKQAVAAMVEAGHAGKPTFRREMLGDELCGIWKQASKDSDRSVKRRSCCNSCGKYGERCVSFNEGVKHCDRHDKARC